MSSRAPFGGRELARIPRPVRPRRSRPPSRAPFARSRRRARFPRSARRDSPRTVAAELERRRDELARTIAAEAGKPLKAARTEAERAAATFSAAAAALEAQNGRDAAARRERGLARALGSREARPARAGPRDHAVQFPAQPHVAQGGAGDRRGRSRRPEAGVPDAALGTRAPGDRPRRRLAGGRVRRPPDRRRAPPRRSSSTRASRSCPSRARARWDGG